MIKLYLAFLLVEIIVIYLLSRSLTSKIFLLLYRSTKNKQKSALLFALIFLPGTFIHESAHFLAALFLLVPVWQMELVPQFDEKTQSLKLGSIPIGQPSAAAVPTAPPPDAVAATNLPLASDTKTAPKHERTPAARGSCSGVEVRLITESDDPSWAATLRSNDFQRSRALLGVVTASPR